MKKMIFFIAASFTMLILLMFHSACMKDVAPLPIKTACDSVPAKFAADIDPIIQTQCVNTGCHSAGGGSSGYDMSTYTLLKPYADNGKLRDRVLNGTNGWMPTSGPLPAADLKKIDCWLQNGAQNN